MAKTTERRSRRKNSPSLDEALKLLKPYRGRDGIYSMLDKNDKGDYTELGVYNYRTKKYTLHRVDMINTDAITEMKEIIKGQ